MKLYHGSTIDIAKVDLTFSKPNKDFGRAFYLSDNRQQALEMAQFRVSLRSSATRRPVFISKVPATYTVSSTVS